MTRFLSAALALALLAAVGVAGARAQQQQEGAVEGEGPGPAVIQGEAGQTRTSAPEVLGRGADVDQDQFVTGEEATAHDEQRFGEITGGGEEMTEEQFTGAMTGAQDAAASFAEVDADQSGQISRAEWTQWRQQRFDEAAAVTEGRMEAGQYETFETGGEAMQ